jgi:raffinose/stachyose/melibiose transport system permease protein
MRLQRWVGRLTQYIVLTIISAMILVPVIMLVIGSLKTHGEFMTTPYTWPSPAHWENYTSILQNPTFWRMLGNSLFIMLCTTAGVVLVCSMAAFIFARMRFPGEGLAFNLLTLGLMFPITVAILPVYLVLRQINLIDSAWGVILVQTAFMISGNIIILRGFFRAIPVELQDAAYIDGATTFGFFWSILLPLARPALSAVAALTMVVSWNDFLIPLVVLNNDAKWTLPLGTMQFQGQYSSNIALVAAFVTISAIPAVIFYLFAERQIVTGLTAGAVKG